MRQKLLFSIVAMFMATAVWAGVKVNAITFPDANFRDWVLRYYCYDDSVLTDYYMTSITRINVENRGITSLQGIEYFTALESLMCDKNLLTSLDLSKNTALKRLECGNPQLTSLDVSGCTELTELNCGGSQLTSLDVSKNTKLETLAFSGNKLTSLDLSKNIKLTWLHCSGTQLTELDVSNNLELESLSCYDNQLTTLDVSKNIKLTWLNCYDNQLTTLDVSKNTALKQLHCYRNLLTSLDVSGCTELLSLYCYQNQIKDDAMDALIATLPPIDIRREIRVIYNENEGNVMTIKQVAEAKSKRWTPMYYDGNTWQKYAGSASYIPINETTFPDPIFRSWVLSQEYGADGVLNDEEIMSVTGFDVSGKGIESLQGIEYFTALSWLYCYANQLTSLDMSKNIKLATLRCSSNQLTTLDVSKNTRLSELWCHSNQLTTLDVSKNTRLSELGCHSNQLTSLDVSGCTALTGLSCYANQLTTLDVSKNTRLSELWCHSNQLTSLDVSNNIELYYLYCYDNRLTALDVSKNTALHSLYCYQNQIKGNAMDALVASLPTVNNGILRVIYNKNEGNVMTTAQVDAAKAKGWIPMYYDGSIWLECDDSESVINAIAINERNFPDPDFRNWVLSQDYGADGMLTASEILSVTSISVAYRGIKSLQGIEYFTALVKLYCYGNQLTSLDVSKNTRLSGLWCYTNHLTALDVSKNTYLTVLSCGTNQLTALDVSKNTELDFLSCHQNQIKDDAMDALVASLPIGSDRSLYIIYNENEGNVMTSTQVEAAKAKGWTPYYFNGERYEWGEEIWQKYAGSEPDGIVSLIGEMEERAVYNLSGLRIGKPQKGINIVNGRKVAY